VADEVASIPECRRGGPNSGSGAAFRYEGDHKRTIGPRRHQRPLTKPHPTDQTGRSAFVAAPLKKPTQLDPHVQPVTQLDPHVQPDDLTRTERFTRWPKHEDGLRDPFAV
jgi:hypothetical protein